MNLTLEEAKSNAQWSHERLFERLWSSLVRLRVQLGVDQDVADVFGLVRNQVPGYILGYSDTGLGGGGGSGGARVAGKVMSPASLLVSFETMMRRLMKSVITTTSISDEVLELQPPYNQHHGLEFGVGNQSGGDKSGRVGGGGGGLSSSCAVNAGASTRLTVTSQGSIKTQQQHV